MLNPEDLEVTRQAGIDRHRIAGRPVRQGGRSDDLLIHTGGGITEMTLSLLFDVTLPGVPIETKDVRELTRPLWNLAENPAPSQKPGKVRAVRFIWGRSWNLLGVVASVAERLEYLSQEGTPRRSWLRMRLLRLPEKAEEAQEAPSAEPDAIHDILDQLDNESFEESLLEIPSIQENQATPVRLDHYSQQVYGRPDLWRIIALHNGIDDPLHPPTGVTWQIPFIGHLLP